MLPLNERAFLYNYLANTLSEKITPEEALGAYEEDIELPKRYHRRLKQAIFLLEKKNLPAALKEAQLIPEGEYALLDYANQKKFLQRILASLGRQLKTRALLQRKIKTLLIYPAVLGLEMLIIIGFALFWLMPQMEFFFRKLNLAQPTLVRFSIALQHTISTLFSPYKFYWIMTASLAGWLIYEISAMPAIKIRLQYLFLRLYKLGMVYRLLIAWEALSALSIIASQNKNDITEELKLISQNTRNLVYQKTLFELAAHLQKGGTFAQFFKKKQCKRLFPGIAQRLLIIGEKQRNLRKSLKTISAILAEEVELEFKHFITILEPTVIIGIALVVLALALMLQNVLGQMYSLQIG